MRRLRDLDLTPPPHRMLSRANRRHVRLFRSRIRHAHCRDWRLHWPGRRFRMRGKIMHPPERLSSKVWS